MHGLHAPAAESAADAVHHRAAHGNGHVHAQFSRDVAVGRVGGERDRLLHAARLEVGRRHEVQFVVARGGHEQIAREDVLLVEQRLVGDVAAEHAYVGKPFHGLAAALRVAVHDHQFLVGVGRGHPEQATPERDVLLLLLPGQKQRAHAVCSENDDPTELLLRRLRVGAELRDVGEARDKTHPVANGERGLSIRQGRGAVRRLHERHEIVPAVKRVQLRERQPREGAPFADGKGRDAKVSVQLDHAADCAVLQRGGNGVGRLDLGVEHGVDAVERTRRGENGLGTSAR